MPTPSSQRPAGRSKLVLWIALGSVVAFGLCGVLCGGAYLFWRSVGKALVPTASRPGSGRPTLDLNNIENTRTWATEAVARLQDANAGKAKSEEDGIEKELKDTLLGKQVRWTFPVEAVDEGEVKLDTFFGKSAGTYNGEDASMRGKPLRRVYLRVFFAAGKDGVRVGDEVTAIQAATLRRGSQWTVARTVTEVRLMKQDQWVSQSPYTGIVDVLEPYCVDIQLTRK